MSVIEKPQSAVPQTDADNEGPPSLTKIVATLGPATDDPASLRKLVDNGASVFRLNFSHGSLDEHAARIREVRSISVAAGRPLAVLGDLQGPKIRVGRMPEEGIHLETGQDFVFRCDIEEGVAGATPLLPSTYERLVDEVEPGHRVLINDGAVRALAVERTSEGLRCRVLEGGLVTTGKGINLPESEISAPAITERDWECARFAVEHDLDYLALSFVRRSEEVRELKDRVGAWCEERCGRTSDGARAAPTIPVIAKIEKPQGVRRIDEILQEADGIMVARGDLGVEMDLATVPVIQKKLIHRAQEFGKPCIVATQMLETMIERSTPTRAEASDVANAIYDQADAVMLSGETAVGKYGPQAVTMMRRISLATEARLRELAPGEQAGGRERSRRTQEGALAHGAWAIASDLGATLVGVWSETGNAARLLSRVGLETPVVAFSSDERAVRRMTLFYGVTPAHQTELPVHRSDFDRLMDAFVIERGMAQEGDRIVLLSGKPFGTPGAVNTVEARTVGERRRR